MGRVVASDVQDPDDPWADWPELPAGCEPDDPWAGWPEQPWDSGGDAEPVHFVIDLSDLRFYTPPEDEAVSSVRAATVARSRRPLVNFNVSHSRARAVRRSAAAQAGAQRTPSGTGDDDGSSSGDDDGIGRPALPPIPVHLSCRLRPRSREPP